MREQTLIEQLAEEIVDTLSIESNNRIHKVNNVKAKLEAAFRYIYADIDGVYHVCFDNNGILVQKGVQHLTCQNCSIVVMKKQASPSMMRKNK